MEDLGVPALVVSMKASDVATTVAAYRRMAAACDYPLHVGVTAAGPPAAAAAKSAIGIGALLLEGIGDTVRVSYTGSPCEEVAAAYAILEALDIRSLRPEIVSCPTCGRCKVALAAMVAEVARRLEGYPADLRVAVMGCVVNGPGEAAEADVGLAAGPGTAMIFREGVRSRRVSDLRAVDALIEEVDLLVGERRRGQRRPKRASACRRGRRKKGGGAE
jgi:(E)-4-hydroxy-3-methylbut-2-enyl-diphosphate synthase